MYVCGFDELRAPPSSYKPRRTWEERPTHCELGDAAAHAPDLCNCTHRRQQAHRSKPMVREPAISSITQDLLMQKPWDVTLGAKPPSGPAWGSLLFRNVPHSRQMQRRTRLTRAPLHVHTAG